MHFVVCVGLCWARVGTILGLSWAILGYVGIFWATLAPYWAHVRGQESKEGKRECEGTKM